MLSRAKNDDDDEQPIMLRAVQQYDRLKTDL